jgi:5'-3' exonuclease
VLALDLNCAIYHCLAKLQKKTPYVATRRKEFEDDLIRAVIQYILKLRDHVQPTDLLYIAVDGVVPMAKIRQQRMRRFKSVWVAAEEAKIKGTDGTGWDRNAITPGTEFMDNLTSRLDAWGSNQLDLKTVVSGVHDSGEGEQKIMSYLRTHGVTGPIIVYGLDADLIVLCLWHHQVYGWSFRLLREDVEMKGSVKLNAFGEETLLYFDINQLATIIKNQWAIPLEDYVGAMSFMGNDFVPHGLTLCIREDGIDRLLNILVEIGKPLVIRDETNNTWTYNIATLKEAIRRVAAMERQWVSETLVKKLKMSSHGGLKRGEEQTEIDKNLAILNSMPLTCKVERTMATRTEGVGWSLNADWGERYYREFMWGATPQDAVTQWLKAVQWILNYYTGTGPVDMLWYYPWYLPPLFKDIAEHDFAELPESDNAPNPITPIAQLVMVLPIESYALLSHHNRIMPIRRPEFYPRSWGFFSAGRRQLWECEPMIPMLPYSVVSQVLKLVKK